MSSYLTVNALKISRRRQWAASGHMGWEASPGGSVHSFTWSVFVEMIKDHTLRLMRILRNKKTYLLRPVHQV